MFFDLGEKVGMIKIIKIPRSMNYILVNLKLSFLSIIDAEILLFSILLT